LRFTMDEGFGYRPAELVDGLTLSWHIANGVSGGASWGD